MTTFWTVVLLFFATVQGGLCNPLCRKYYEGRSIATLVTQWGAWQVERSELGHLKWNRYDAKTGKISTIREEHFGSTPVITDEILKARLSDNGQILLVVTAGQVTAVDLDQMRIGAKWFGKGTLATSNRIIKAINIGKDTRSIAVLTENGNQELVVFSIRQENGKIELIRSGTYNSDYSWFGGPMSAETRLVAAQMNYPRQLILVTTDQGQRFIYDIQSSKVRLARPQELNLF